MPEILGGSFEDFDAFCASLLSAPVGLHERARLMLNRGHSITDQVVNYARDRETTRTTSNEREWPAPQGNVLFTEWTKTPTRPLPPAA
eukprot:913139-Pyramimonas_sp.AAC.1